MGRTLVVRIYRSRNATTFVRALFKARQLRFKAIELPGHVQHRLVLFDDVALQPREAFFQKINSFARHGAWMAGWIGLSVFATRAPRRADNNRDTRND